MKHIYSAFFKIPEWDGWPWGILWMGAGNGWLVDADFEHARPFKTITSMSFQLGRSLGLGMGVGFSLGYQVLCYLLGFSLF